MTNGKRGVGIKNYLLGRRKFSHSGMSFYAVSDLLGCLLVDVWCVASCPGRDKGVCFCAVSGSCFAGHIIDKVFMLAEFT